MKCNENYDPNLVKFDSMIEFDLLETKIKGRTNTTSYSSKPLVGILKKGVSSHHEKSTKVVTFINNTDDLRDSLERLNKFEESFKVKVSNLTNMINELNKRIHIAKKILRVNPVIDMDQVKVDNMLEETERAHALILNSSLKFLEESIEREIDYINELEKSNKEREAYLNCLQVELQEIQSQPRVSTSEQLENLMLLNYSYPDIDVQGNIERVCEYIKIKKEKLLNYKKRLDHIESEYEKLRNDHQERLQKKQQKIDELLSAIDQKNTCKQKINLIEEDIHKQKIRIASIKLEKEQYERQIFTCSRDKKFTDKYIKNLEVLKENNNQKKNEIEAKIPIINEKKLRIQRLMDEIKAFEERVSERESHVIFLENMLNQNSNDFHGTIDLSKKEIDEMCALTANYQSNVKIKTIGEQINQILDESVYV